MNEKKDLIEFKKSPFIQFLDYFRAILIFIVNSKIFNITKTKNWTSIIQS